MVLEKIMDAVSMPEYMTEDYVRYLTPSIVVIVALASAFLCIKRSSEASPSLFSFNWPVQIRSGWQGIQADPSLFPSSPLASRTSAIQCHCPASGELLGSEVALTTNGIDRAIQAAKSAQPTWASTTFAERRRVLRSLQQFILDNKERIAKIACLDTGKTKVDALFGEILVTCAKIDWTLRHGEQALRPDHRPTSLLMFYKSNTIHYEPLGVVGACVSWNYPFHNLLGPVIAALFTGNAIVVKTSEQTAWSSNIFRDMVADCLAACGHSRDLVRTVTCWPRTADHFTSHPDISHLTFIGSRPVARKVCASAATAITPLVVELGGKDAAIVLDGPDGGETSESEMNRIASILMRGVFQSAGQNCVGIERIIAMPRSYARLETMLSARIGKLRVGNPVVESVDVGAIISPTSFDRLESLIDEAVTCGAALVHGGKRYVHPTFPNAHFFSPTLLTDVRPEMRIAREEVFAPICVLMRAESVPHAIGMANATPYGLGSSVFGPVSAAPARRNLERVVEGLRTGMVAVNDFGAYYTAQLPFGGLGGSGYGRFAGTEGLRGLCNAKSTSRDRWPGRIRTAIPAAMDYPMTDGAWRMGAGVVDFAYGTGLRAKVRGLTGMLMPGSSRAAAGGTD